MYSIIISLLLIPSFSHTSLPGETIKPQELEVIINELDLVLDSFFALIDEQDLDTFIAGVRHASRARLLLEQVLGEGIDRFGVEEATTQQERTLRLIAKRAQDLSGDAGRELWRQDYDDKQWALLRLSELENLVKGLKKSIADQ